ncbi:MAG: hypothetical protein AAF725_17165 [Acidobacteriota bacterium]
MGALLAFLVALAGLVIPPSALVALAFASGWSPWTRAGLSLLVIVAAANLTLWPYLLRKDPFPYYYYESREGDFRTREATKLPGSFKSVHERFSRFQEASGGSEDLLFRTFPRRPHHFWMWREYLLDARWRLPYKKPRYCPFTEQSGKCAGYPPGPDLFY